jgi:hypothetical protein
VGVGVKATRSQQKCRPFIADCRPHRPLSIFCLK